MLGTSHGETSPRNYVQFCAGFYPADVVFGGDLVDTCVFSGHLADLDNAPVVLFLDGQPGGGGEVLAVFGPGDPGVRMTHYRTLKSRRLSPVSISKDFFQQSITGCELALWSCYTNSFKQ